MTPSDVKTRSQELRAEYLTKRAALERETLAPIDARLAEIAAQVETLLAERSTLVELRAEIMRALAGDSVTLADALLSILETPYTMRDLCDVVRTMFGDEWERGSIETTLARLVRERKIGVRPVSKPKVYGVHEPKADEP